MGFPIQFYTVSIQLDTVYKSFSLLKAKDLYTKSRATAQVEVRFFCYQEIAQAQITILGIPVPTPMQKTA